nr:AT-rich interaction domain 6 [Nothobranchius furzeri]
METQVQVNMAQGEVQEKSTKDPTEEITEEQFLKNLYIFMKKRDTPIERIPNLGFKQIDLFVMFRTVNELGGYHQVTSHQLWKRVYNSLGGNPRSTSAATCTRRHYEKLLLPYECHLKGILMSSSPQLQPKPYRYTKDDEGGQRPSKRRLLSLPTGSHSYQSDPHGTIFPLHLPFHHYYNLTHAILPAYVPIPSSVLTPHVPSLPKPESKRMFFQTSQLNSINAVKEPLEQLRFLAEQYKTSEGLMEPLNLSKKESPREAKITPVSSFSPPSSSKNPKFLNKPSSLYSPHQAGVLRREASETQDGESNEGALVFSEPLKEKMDSVDVKALTPSRSPVNDSDLIIDEDVFEVMSTSPKTNVLVGPAEEREVRLSRETSKEEKDNMEIEVPLSVFRNWLKLWGSSAKLPEVNGPFVPDPELSSGQKSWSGVDSFPSDLTSWMNPHNQDSAGDLRLKKEPSPSPKPNTQTTSHQNSSSQSLFTDYKFSPSGVAPKIPAGREIWPLKQQDQDPYSGKYTKSWKTQNKDTQAPSKPVATDSSFIRPPQVIAPRFVKGDTVWGGQQRLEMEPAAVVMVDSIPASVLPLTKEEVMKLKKIISSSS